MYRAPDHITPTPPTRIEYVSKVAHLRVFPLSAMMFLISLGIVASLHITHFTCRPDQCRVASCGTIVGTRGLVIPTFLIRDFHVNVHTTSKGAKYAVAGLDTDGGPVDLSGNAFIGHFDVDSAQEARAAYKQFMSQSPSNRDVADLDVWITQGWGTYLMAYIFAFLSGLFGFLLVCEYTRQRRPICILVDHDRHVVIVNKREIPTTDIAHVELEQGRAFPWSSGKKEFILGWRIVIKTRDLGEEIATTKDFRAGSRADHEHARKALIKVLADMESARLASS